MKASPYDLELEPIQPLTRVFTHYAKPRWTCSCGESFNIEEGVCPKGALGHIVTENPPRKQFSIRFKVLGAVEGMSVQNQATQMYAKYVTGYGQEGKPGYVAPIPMMGAMGKPVPMSEESCLVAAILCKAQFPTSPEELYTFEELCAFMLSDAICLQMSKAAMDVQVGEDESPLASSVVE